MTKRRWSLIFYLAEVMILLVISFQAVQVSTSNTNKIDRLKTVSKDEKLHQRTYPLISRPVVIAMAAQKEWNRCTSTCIDTFGNLCQ